MVDNVSRKNAQNTFEELFEMGIIPIVNENDTVSTYEMQFGDNDSLSAIVASLVGADLLILLSDIDGLYTDDPRKNPKAELIPVVEKIDNRIENMAGDTVGSDVGTGGMTTKLTAARIATLSGADMIIANAKDVGVLHQIFEGKQVGTFFKANKNDDFYIADYVAWSKKMIENIIARINELYHKSQKEGLTPEEKEEQAALRKEYIASVKRNLKGQLDNIDMVNADGTVTNLGEKYGNKGKHQN